MERLNSVTAEGYMTAVPRPRFDIVSYHFYGALAERCASPNSDVGIWLSRP